MVISTGDEPTIQFINQKLKRIEWGYLPFKTQPLKKKN